MTASKLISVRVPAGTLAKVDQIRASLQADALPGQTYTRTDVILWAIEALADNTLDVSGVDMSEPHPVV